MAMPPEVPARPVLTIVRGEPTAAELAAVLVVLVGQAASAATEAAQPAAGGPVLSGPLRLS